MFGKPILDYHITNIPEISSALTCRAKVQSFFADNGKELQELLEKQGCRANAKHILDKNIDNTELLVTMMNKRQTEAMALCLLFKKPKIDANKIAHLLFNASTPQDPPDDRQPGVCLLLSVVDQMPLRS